MFCISQGRDFMKNDDLSTLPELVQEYLNYLSVIKAKSNLTILEYASDLRLFFAYLTKKSSDESVENIDISFLDLEFIKKATPAEAYAFLNYCKNVRNNDASARARKVVSIKRFYRYLKIQGYIERNPMQDLESPKIKKSLPKYLSLDQAVDLLQSVDGQYKERDYCILVLFMNCGLRLSELVSLNCSHIRSDNTMVITGKGNKQRTVYLNDACMDAIKAYMAVRPVDGVKDREALFISRQMNRISPKTVQHIVKQFLEKSGLGNQGFSTHKLRHTAATLMYQYGHVDVLQLKEILGHENLATTEIYTHVVDEQLRQAVDKNPLNNIRINKDNISSNNLLEDEDD